MDAKTIQALFNPVRMKIILTLTAKQQCTTKELQEALQDIPQASLYRHIAMLVKLEVLEVINETKVRGATERTYQLRYDPYNQINQQALDGDKDSVNNVFYHFIMAQLGEFTNYLYKENSDIVKDGVGFRSYPMYLTEEEHLAFIKDFGELLQKHAGHSSSKDRTLRKFSFIYMPGEDK